MARTLGSVLGGLAGALALAGAPLTAQAKLEVLATVGVHHPVQSDMGEIPVRTGGTVKGTTKTASIVGGRASLWLDQKWGLEVSGFRAPGADFQISSLDRGPLIAVDAKVEAASLRAFHRVGRWRSGFGVLLGAGLTAIRHDGPAFEGLESRTRLAPSADLTLHLPMGPTLVGRVDGELFFYRLRSGSPLQRDVVFSAGLGLRL